MSSVSQTYGEKIFGGKCIASHSYQFREITALACYSASARYIYSICHIEEHIYGTKLEEQAKDLKNCRNEPADAATAISDIRLEKVALDGIASSAVRLRRDGVTLNFDLLTQKRNQVICVPRCTSDKSLAKICQQILEISRKHENLGCIRSCCDLDL